MSALEKQRSRFLHDERGQALVEFAITAPVMVLILLFSIWFYELIQIKLKVQEASRYAVFEATAHRFHDYGDSDGKPADVFKYGQASITEITTEATLRYRHLDSAQGVFAGRRYLSASFDPPQFLISNRFEDPLPANDMVNTIFVPATYVFDLLRAMLYKHKNYYAHSLLKLNPFKLGKTGGGMMNTIFGPAEWGFNQRGYVNARVKVVVRNEWFQAGVGRFIMPNVGHTITDEYSMLVDSWRLNYNAHTRPIPDDRNLAGVSPDSKLWQQVARMFFVQKKTRNLARGFLKGIRLGLEGASYTALAFKQPKDRGPAFSEPSVIAKSYTDADAGKRNVPHGKVDDKPMPMDTAPLIDEYEKTLKARGGYFMGCRQPMKLGCTDTLGSDNPFGDYIIRE
ncbi:MAG: pilus assembly protein [Deltaproteobacteria bacterium]|nr:pilus assembly protein [Deltaproteobacteria bacterium]